MDVSIHFPFLMAQREAPDPKWQEINLYSFVPSNSSTTEAIYL